MQTKEKSQETRGPIELVEKTNDAPKAQTKSNLIVAFSTLLGGLVLAGFLIYLVRKEKVVEVEVKGDPLPPIVVTKEVRVEVPVPAPAPPPIIIEKVVPPPPPPPPEPLGWEYEGTWRVINHLSAFPAFTLRQTTEGVTGGYAPLNGNGVFPFKGGTMVDNVLEFSVTDQLGHRIFFAMTFKSDSTARVVTWRTAEDVLADVQKTASARLPPVQRQAVMRVLSAELKMAGKRLPIGTFKKVKVPGQE